MSAGKILGLVALLAVGLATASSLVTEHALVVPPPPSSDAWLEMRKPMPVYTLTGTDFARLPLDYTAARNGLDASRRDSLTFGDPHGDKPWLRLWLTRIDRERAPVGAGMEDVARLGRDTGLVVSRIAPATTLQTRFGAFEASDLKIGTGTGALSCLGFRRDPYVLVPLRIDGLMCGTAERPAARDLLGCVIDRIDLLAAGDDRTLRDLFVAAERRRGSSCRPALESQSGRGKSWLDVNSAPPPLRPLGIKAPRSW